VDIFGHLSDDELGIMLTETNRTGAAILSDRLLSIVTNSSVITTAGLIKITFSAGVAVMPADAANLQVVLDMASSALQSAQRNGRNRIVFNQKEK
jgi:diguanylate cyclase (GGDEF)-like protein